MAFPSRPAEKEEDPGKAARAAAAADENPEFEAWKVQAYEILVVKQKERAAECDRVSAKVQEIPESIGGREVFRRRLGAIQKTMDSGGDHAALASEVARIEEQIGKVLSAKPRSPSEEEAHKKWVKETYDPKKAGFARECSDVTARLVAAARQRAQEISGDAAAKVDFDFISDKVMDTRLTFEQEFLLEGSGGGADLLKRFQAQLAAVDRELDSLVNGAGFAKLVGDKVDAGDAQAAERKLKAEQDAQQKEFKAAKDKAMAALGQLEDLGHAKAAEYRKQLADEKDKAKVAKIQGSIEAAVKEHRQNMDREAAAHEEFIKGVAESVGKATKKVAHPDAKKALESLNLELARTKALAKTGNEAAIVAAKEISKQVDDLAKAAGVADSPFNLLFAGVKEQQDKLDDADVKKYFNTEQKVLSAALTKVAAAVDPLELSAAQKDLEGLKAKIEALETRSQDLALWRQSIEHQLKRYKGMMQGYRDSAADRNNPVTRFLGSGYDKFLGSETKISLLMEEIEKTYRQPGVDPAGISALGRDLGRRVGQLEGLWWKARKLAQVDPQEKKLDPRSVELAVKGAVDALKSGLKKEADDGEEARQQKLKDDARKEEELGAWKKEYEAFQDQVGVLESAVEKHEGPKDEIETINKLAEAGDQLAQSGDLAGARDKLKLAEARREKLSKYPGGVTMRSADKLRQAPQKWVVAIGDLEKKLKSLKSELDKEELSEESRAAAKAQIDAIPKLFVPGVFVKDIDIIVKSEDTAARKQARERILKQVRRYRAIMQANAALQLVRRNPFGVKQVTKDVQDCLASIELNTLRAVRAS